MLSIRRSFHVVALLILTLVASLSAARGEDALTRLPVPADLAERDEWVGIYIQGKKCGYGHATRRRASEDGSWVTTFQLQIDLTSFGQQTTLETSGRSEYAGVAPHALLRATHTTSQSGQAQRVELERKDGAYAATITAAGTSRELKLASVDYTLGDEIAPELWCLQGPEVGATIRARTFDVGDLEADVSTYTVLSNDTAVAGGVKIAYRTLKMTKENDGSEGTARVDAHGNVLSMTLGSFAEVRLEPEDVAKQTEVSSDLFVLGMVRIDKPIGDAPNVRELVVEVSGDDGRALTDGPHQRVHRDEKTGVVTLSLGKAHSVAEKPTEAEIAEALAETVEYPLRNPRVVALAKEAVGDAKTDREKVKRLVAFVSRFVEDAISADSPTVEHLLAKKKGDCTEHALLFTALARAAGVPTREAGGLMYVGDEIRAFGGHAWNEVVLDGEWVAVDATWDQLEVDATHVRLGAGRKSTGQWLKTFGKLSFELRTVKLKD